MGSGVTVVIDVSRARAQLSVAAQKQIPFAAAQAVNTLAFEVMRAERANTRKVFAHERPFTERGTVVQKKASKADPMAIVGLRPEVAAYLAPFEFGGLHHLPGKGLALLNPKSIKLDQYGQLRGRPSALAARPGVFVGKVQTKAGPVAGFWKRTKKHGLQLLVRFGDALPVKKRLHFDEVARRLIAARAEAAFSAALTRALAARR